MNAIEIRGLSKSFRGLYALNGLNMTVPVGSIYGFIGENGSGKSTTMKLLCGHLVADGGKIKLFGKEHTDPGVRVRVGALIENAGCFPGSSVYQNLMMQCINLGLSNADEEIHRALKIVRMEEHAQLKFKKCSLGMKQRIGIAMALLGSPKLLILDEPINGLDVDGMRIMREVLVDIAASGATILISSHVLGELEKVATHYGIIRHGKMICEMTAAELEASCRTYVALQTVEMSRTKNLLGGKYSRVEEDEAGFIRIYNDVTPEEIVAYLYENGILVSEVGTAKIGLEEYYIDLMKEGK